MKHPLRFLLLVLTLCLLACSSALADSNVTFTKGEQVVLFDEGGVKFTLDGEVTDEGIMILQLHGVLENKNNVPLRVSYTGTCNGWSLGNCIISGAASTTAANSKAKGFLTLSTTPLTFSGSVIWRRPPSPSRFTTAPPLRMSLPSKMCISPLPTMGRWS